MTRPPLSAAEGELEQVRIAELVRAAPSDAAALQQLIALLDEPRWTLRRQVIAALAELGEPALAALLHSLQSDRASETRIAATVDTLVASAGDVEGALLGGAESDSAPVCADVAQILGRRRNPRAVPKLIALLNHADDNVAVAAIEALGRVGGRAAVDALVEAVERDYFFRTYPAIDVLGRSGDPRAVAPLARLLRKSQYVLEAARALGRTADKSAVAPLCELLVSPANTNVRVAALALVELIESHRQLYGGAIVLRDALSASANEAATRRISQTLASADAAERVALCFVLGALQNEAAAPALASMLDGAPAVASAAAAALQQLGRASDERLRSALIEGDSARRMILLPLLPRSGGTAAVLACLDDPDATVRALACDALARMGDVTAVPKLFEHLGENNARVVQAASAAIQSLGTAETEALAIAAARSQAAGTRRAALRILAYFGYVGAIDVFEAALRDADPRVRDVAITGLPFIEHPRARTLLLTAATDSRERERAAAMRGLGQSSADDAVVAALRRGLEDPDAWVRYYACQALGKLGSQSAAGAIAALFADPAGQVRVGAVEALSHLKSAPALAALQSAAAADEPDVQRAALIGLGLIQSAESLPVLIAACSAPAAATRLVALSSLSTLVTPETLQVVARALNDEDESVRVAAIGLLASWPDARATRILIDALHNESMRGRILQALSTPTSGRAEGLLNALDSADDELALTLSSALSRVDARGALLTALESPNVPARKAAAAVLAVRASREGLAALARHASGDPSEEVRRVCALLLAR